MKNRILSVIAVLALASAMTQSAFARPPHGERMLERMSEQLNLTDEQVASIKTLFEQKMENKQNVSASYQEVETLIEAGDTLTAADLAAELARQRVLSRSEFLNEIKGILTEEQYDEWQAVRANHKQHRGYNKFQ